MTVDSFRPQSENLILDEGKLDNFKATTINSWISSKVGKEHMNRDRNAADELSAALSRIEGRREISQHADCSLLCDRKGVTPAYAGWGPGTTSHQDI